MWTYGVYHNKELRLNSKLLLIQSSSLCFSASPEALCHRLLGIMMTLNKWKSNLLRPSHECFICWLLQSLQNVEEYLRQGKKKPHITSNIVQLTAMLITIPSPMGRRDKKTAAHAQSKKREKTKMADEGRVSVNSKQTVLRIHEKLKKEVHQIAEKKSWTVKQKDEFEKKLLEVGRSLDFPCRRELIRSI